MKLSCGIEFVAEPLVDCMLELFSHEERARLRLGVLPDGKIEMLRLLLVVKAEEIAEMAKDIPKGGFRHVRGTGKNGWKESFVREALHEVKLGILSKGKLAKK